MKSPMIIKIRVKDWPNTNVYSPFCKPIKVKADWRTYYDKRVQNTACEQHKNLLLTEMNNDNSQTDAEWMLGI